MDFSEAERVGFVNAFVDFWRHDGTTRTVDDLRISAQHLLKGCQQHFRAEVTRIKKIGGVIPLGSASKFEKLALGLLKVDNLKTFQKRSHQLLSSFPEVAPWLEWWLRDTHAPMLFTPYRQMEASLWSSLPATTNAEEAMHWKIYAGIGQDQTLMSGLTSLYAFAGHYERLLAGASGMYLTKACTLQYHLLFLLAVGAPIRYGAAEPWKKTFQRIGRTKPTRDPARKVRERYRNDGRPPDTRNAMLRGKKRQKTLQQKLAVKLGAKAKKISNLKASLSTEHLSKQRQVAPLKAQRFDPHLSMSICD